MRSAAYLGIAILTILLESNLFRLLEPLAALLGPRWVHGATPSLVLPLIIYLGVHEPSMPKGAALGVRHRLRRGPPVRRARGALHVRFRRGLVAVARGRRPADGADRAASHEPRWFVFAFVESAIVLILLAVFGNDNQPPRGDGERHRAPRARPRRSLRRSCSGSRSACAQARRRWARRKRGRPQGEMNFLVQRSDVGEFRRRYRWLVLVVIVAFLSLVGRLMLLQIVEGDVHRAKRAGATSCASASLATTRGVIRDAYGRVLGGESALVQRAT